MEQDINENLKKISTWKRIFFIAVFAVIVGLVRILLWAIVLLQIASTLYTGSPNQNILDFGSKLSAYLYHILLFLTYNTEKLPFPFSDWNLTEELKLPDIEKEK
jgi:cytoskeletal protein RodZ